MSQVNEIRKVVLYKDKTFEFISIPSCYFDTTMIRMSEEVEVSFPLLPEDVRINSEVEQINKEIVEIKTKTIQKIEELEQRKQELLAIGFDGEAHGS